MKTKNVFSVGLVLVAGMVAASALFFPVVADARNIKVGIIDTYSGPPAVFGNDALNGFKMALDEINKQGVLGGKIDIVTRDDKFKVDIGLNMAKEVVLKENVDILVGVVNSGVAMAVSDAVAKKEKIPFITWMGKSENITGKAGHRYFVLWSGIGLDAEVAQTSGKRWLMAKRPGVIVNIASILGLRTIGQVAPYNASKAGLIHLTRALAMEWARHDIRVNAIGPGTIATELARKAVMGSDAVTSQSTWRVERDYLCQKFRTDWLK